MASKNSVAFPPLQYLGYGLDLTAVTPFDITAVKKAVKHGRRLIEFDADTKTRPVNIRGTVYNVPKNISVSKSIPTVDGKYVTYRSGSEAAAAFEADPDRALSYLAVTASDGHSASYSLTKSFRGDNQFALYSYNSVHYGAELTNYVDHLAEDGLLRWLPDLTTPFPKNPSESVVREYRAFFDAFGTHVITNTTYGARLQLNAWASNENEEINRKFSDSVLASFNGLASNGKFDASVKAGSDYKEFLDRVHQSISVQGGDETLAAELVKKPGDYKKYIAWTHTVTQRSDAVSFETTEVWKLLREAGDSVIRDRANDIQAAFEYITSEPQPHSTAITVNIDSDWGSFNLTTPGAKLVADPAFPLPRKTKLTETSVVWDNGGYNFDQVTLKFFLFNDGSRIDFWTGHGDLNGHQGFGDIKVSIEGKQYVNGRQPGDPQNKKAFHQVPVSEWPAASRFALSGHDSAGKRTWSETLYDFLQDQGAKQNWQPVRWETLKAPLKPDLKAYKKLGSNGANGFFVAKVAPVGLGIAEPNEVGKKVAEEVIGDGGSPAPASPAPASPDPATPAPASPAPANLALASAGAAPGAPPPPKLLPADVAVSA